MDPYTVRKKGYEIDPYYKSLHFPIHSLKVIPVVDEDAKIFPSWNQRKLVCLELIFNPFTLEIVVLLHDGPKKIELNHKKPREKGKSGGVIISPSYFIPVMNSKNQRHVELYRAMDAEDKLLAFYENSSPTFSPQSLTSKIADQILVALMAMKKEVNPSLEFCFESSKHARAFFYAWKLAFGREVDIERLKQNRNIKELARTELVKNELTVQIENIPIECFGTPVSFQSPLHASASILPPLVYESEFSTRVFSSSFVENALNGLECHDYGGGATGNPRTLEIFIPCDKLAICQGFKYPKLTCWVEVIPEAKLGGGQFRSILTRVLDSSIRMIRDPVLPVEERRKHLSGITEGEIETWTNGNPKRRYWCLKLSFHNPAQSISEKPLGTVSIRFPLIYNYSTQPIRSALYPASWQNNRYDPNKARPIDEVFLGHRLGRLLPDIIVQETNLTAPVSLHAEQAKVFNHVLTHDFTLVDGAPGTGKSRVTKEIILRFLSQKKKVLVLAPSESSLECLVRSVLSKLPQSDIRALEPIARLCPLSDKLRTNKYRHTAMEVVTIEVPYGQPAGANLDHFPQAVEDKAQLERASLIFMSLVTAERINPFFGMSRRTFDLVILDDANACSESAGLQLTQYPFVDARWLVIGCSNGISPAVNIDLFKDNEVSGSWFNRLLRHPEFRLNPLRLTKQSRCRKALYEPINNMFFGGTIISTSDTPQERGDHELCMGFVNTSRVVQKRINYPNVLDDELTEHSKHRREIFLILQIAQKIHNLTPHASITVLCYSESQKPLLESEWYRVGTPLSNAGIFIDTIDGFASQEADYAIVHIPLWEDSYEYSNDPGRFVIAMTRARKGAFAVGNLAALAASKTWGENPWKGWLGELDKSANGAVFDKMDKLMLTMAAQELAAFKAGPWVGEEYTEEERTILRGYW